MNKADVALVRQVLEAIRTGALPEGLSRHALADAVDGIPRHHRGLRQPAWAHLDALLGHLRGWSVLPPQDARDHLAAVEDALQAYTRKWATAPGNRCRETSKRIAHRRSILTLVPEEVPCE